MDISDQDLYQILLENQFITESKLKKIKEYAIEEKISLYNAILQKDILLEEQLVQLIADFLKLLYIDLSTVTIQPDVLQILPESFARKQRIIAFKKTDGYLSVATTNPANTGAIEFVKRKVASPVTVYLTTTRDIENALSGYVKEVHKAFDDILNENIQKVHGIATGEQEAPIIKIVDTMLSYAYQDKASDIHIEPEKRLALVRFRIDGVLHDIV